MKPHQNLDVWKKSFAFVKAVYSATSCFPSEEKFGLTSQLRRAAVSVPVNIAEGAARKSDKEFLNFLYISLGSASEIDTLLLLAKELNFISEKLLEELLFALDIIFKMILGLINRVKTRIPVKA